MNKPILHIVIEIEAGDGGDPNVVFATLDEKLAGRLVMTKRRQIAAENITTQDVQAYGQGETDVNKWSDEMVSL